MAEDQILGDDVVLARTLAGQKAALADDVALGPLQHRFLLLVNGFTTLGDWFDRMPRSPEAVGSLRSLMELGLVEPVDG